MMLEMQPVDVSASPLDSAVLSHGDAETADQVRIQAGATKQTF